MEYLRLSLSALASWAANLVGAFRRRRPPKLLVVKLDHLGDVVLATPAFRALRAAFPGAPLHALVGPWASEVLAGNPAIDRVILYDSARFRRSRSPGSGVQPPIEVMRALAEERYTHVIELRGDSWTLLLPFLTGALRRVDRGTVRARRWLSRRMRASDPSHTGGSLHEVETNLAVVRPLLGSFDFSTTPQVEVFLLERDREEAGKALQELGIPGGATLVVLHPGASWEPRAWRPERFAEVARRVLAREGTHLLIVGAAGEHDLRARLQALVQGPRTHFLFGAPLCQVAAILERSALFIGNDSGIAHLAAATGAPVIALFGPQDPRRFRPWSDRAIVLHKAVPCFPCRQVVCAMPENPCVNRNTVEEVMRSVEAFLGPVAEARSGT